MRGAQGNRAARLDTTLEYDDPDSLTRLSLGECRVGRPRLVAAGALRRYPVRAGLLAPARSRHHPASRFLRRCRGAHHSRRLFRRRQAVRAGTCSRPVRIAQPAHCHRRRHSDGRDARSCLVARRHAACRSTRPPISGAGLSSFALDLGFLRRGYGEENYSAMTRRSPPPPGGTAMRTPSPSKRMARRRRVWRSAASACRVRSAISAAVSTDVAGAATVPRARVGSARCRFKVRTVRSPGSARQPRPAGAIAISASLDDGVPPPRLRYQLGLTTGLGDAGSLGLTGSGPSRKPAKRTSFSPPPIR